MSSVLWLRLAFSLGTFTVLALLTRWLFRIYVGAQGSAVKLALGVGTFAAGVLLVCSVIGVLMNVLTMVGALTTP